MTPRRVIRTGVDGSTPSNNPPSNNGSGTSDIDSCPSSTPPYVCIWNGSIGNIGQNNIPTFRETSEFHPSIDRILSNDSNAPSIGSQILCDEFSVSSGRGMYLHFRMNVVAEIVQPMRPELVSHGIQTIDTLNENDGILIPATSIIRRTPNTTHGKASEHGLGQVTLVGESVGDYKEENYKLILKLRTKIPNFKAIVKIFSWVNHLWIWLLLVQKCFDHIWIRVLLMRKCQMQKHQQRTLHHMD